MRGKLVNSVVAGMNFIFGALVLFFNFYMPSKSRANAAELNVIGEIDRFIFVLMIIVAVINLITLIFNRKDKILLLAYALAIFSSIFYFVEFNYVSTIYILAALMIEIQVFRENMLYSNNMFYIVMCSIVIVAIGLAGLNVLTYKDKVHEIVKEESKGYVQYSEDFFKNVAQLGEDQEFYINVQRNDKWGYINTNGDIKIPFEYDYASPFITINKYDKKFDIALVCQEDTSMLILKNRRTVMSFKSQIAIDDYQKQMEKLQEIYSDTLNQEGKITELLSNVPTSKMNTISSYEKYPYRYPFNDEYDIYITVSQTGGKNRYEFMKKDNSNVKVSIDCDNLKFDGNNLYVFSNGFLPFYKRSEGIQGWYTKETRRIEIPGNMQVLEFYDDNILMRDYDKQIVYFTNWNGDKISEDYKDIFVLDDSYIVKNMAGKYIVINKSFEKILDIEYDFIDPQLIENGILICANLPLKVNFNNSGFPSNIEYDIVDLTGKKITLKNPDQTEIENPAYTGIYYINNKKVVSSYEAYLNTLTDIFYEFVGEEFYQ